MRLRFVPWGIALLAGCIVAPPPESRNRQALEKAEELFLLEQYKQAAGHYEIFLSENPMNPPCTPSLGGSTMVVLVSPEGQGFRCAKGETFRNRPQQVRLS